MSNTASILSRTLLVYILLVAPAAAQEVMVGSRAMYPDKDIIDNAVNSRDHETLVAAVKAADLVVPLKGEGPFTVFAPTDAAFASLPPGTVASLFRPELRSELANLLRYHVVPGSYTFVAIAKAIDEGGGEARLETESGEFLRARFNGPRNITILDERGDVANISTYDVIQSNGVMHVVDRVLFPPVVSEIDPGTGPEIRTSRLFAARGDYPPSEFSAYGIVAFRSAATSSSRARYVAICEGYFASIAPALELQRIGVPMNEQMATVWPLIDKNLARRLNEAARAMPVSEDCDAVVADIDVITSQDAIRKAQAASGTLSGAGPFLLAWSPASSFGHSQVPVLVMDLSDVTNSDQATARFVDWVTQIEAKPELWRAGWSIEKLRIQLQLFADKYGSEILRLLGV